MVAKFWGLGFDSGVQFLKVVRLGFEVLGLGHQGNMWTESGMRNNSFKDFFRIVSMGLALASVLGPGCPKAKGQGPRAQCPGPRASGPGLQLPISDVLLLFLACKTMLLAMSTYCHSNLPRGN